MNHADIFKWHEKLAPVYEELLAQLKERWPEGRGVREYIAILQLHQRYPAEEIAEAVAQALEFGGVHLDGVQLCLNQLLNPEPTPAILDAC